MSSQHNPMNGRNEFDRQAGKGEMWMTFAPIKFKMIH